MRLVISLLATLIITNNLASAQKKTVVLYSDSVNVKLTTLMSLVANAHSRYSDSFITKLNNISDMYYIFQTSITRDQHIESFNNDKQLVAEIENYNDILSYYLTDTHPHQDSLLSFFLEDLQIKNASGFYAQTTLAKKRLTLHVKVMDKMQTKELPGYQVIVKPFASLDPNLKIELNPTNKAVLDFPPGDKKVSILYNNLLLQERRVILYVNDSTSIFTEIFVIE